MKLAFKFTPPGKSGIDMSGEYRATRLDPRPPPDEIPADTAHFSSQFGDSHDVVLRAVAGLGDVWTRLMLSPIEVGGEKKVNFCFGGNNAQGVNNLWFHFLQLVPVKGLLPGAKVCVQHLGNDVQSRFHKLPHHIVDRILEKADKVSLRVNGRKTCMLPEQLLSCVYMC
eukprot:TRINITY_DN9469_c0_g1_i1.p2 TRINITY_DN9469_c0_g1~~TRINITY_DN9469_c0_g1_i1.p2  ORF type:complete len:181 (+),score=14.74 TRINITY_DN9469_c0_g1_i1:37-543(+)